MLYTIANGILEVTVNSLGGSMTSVKYLGEERQWQGGEAWKGQDVVIFPIVGHAGEYKAQGKTYAPKSHGVARYAEFTVFEKSDNRLILSLSSDDTTRATYPYDFDLQVSYELDENCLTVGYFVRSKRGIIPFYVGGHPGMKAPGGEAIIEFENEEAPVLYPLESDEAVSLNGFKRFVANKPFFKQCKTFQLGGLSGGKIYAITVDGYRYTYQSDCPVWAFWSNESEGDYICVEPWWGINDYPTAPREITLKPFMNFADGKGKSFSYKLAISKE